MYDCPKRTQMVESGVAAISAAVIVAINTQTHALRSAGYDCIKTMKFVGYRFVPS